MSWTIFETVTCLRHGDSFILKRIRCGNHPFERGVSGSFCLVVSGKSGGLEILLEAYL